MNKKSKFGFEDVVEGLSQIRLSLFLAKADIRQRYRRSSLGPFWITISTGVMIACIGLIFGKLFKSPMDEFFPFLASGLIIWAFVSQCISESTTVFVVAEPVIKQLPLPLSLHVLRMVLRNFFIFLHNIIIIPIVLLFVHRVVNWNILFLFPGIILLLVNLVWISLILGIVCARYRDMSQIVASVLQVFFYVTPIIWLPSLLPARSSVMLIDPNPLYHLIELVRAPLMGDAPSLLTWFFSALLAASGWFLTIAVFNKYRGRIAYWL